MALDLFAGGYREHIEPQDEYLLQLADVESTRVAYASIACVRDRLS